MEDGSIDLFPAQSAMVEKLIILMKDWFCSLALGTISDV